MAAMMIITLCLLVVVGSGILVGNHYMEKAVHNDAETDSHANQASRQSA